MFSNPLSSHLFEQTPQKSESIDSGRAEIAQISTVETKELEPKDDWSVLIKSLAWETKKEMK
jgi:hypothetical protein